MNSADMCLVFLIWDCEMIFVGDISSPSDLTTRSLIGFFKEQSNVFGKKCFVGNLEGLLYDRDPSTDNQPVLSNHPSLPFSMKKVLQPVFCLANNHMLDLPGEFDSTQRTLQKEHIPFGGASSSMKEALSPLFFHDGDKEIVLFNACWDFLLYNSKNPTSGVSVGEIDEEWMIREVSNYRVSRPESSIVVYLHWNLDLETLPFPIHRQFSRALIDAGAKVVVGTHAHCVQGGEKYNDGYIIYGLGNFFLPQHLFVGGKLRFPAFANIQLALEWNSTTGKATCHWIEYQYSNNNHSLRYLGSDLFEDSDKLNSYSPFLGMTDKEYYRYYKKNRRKKLLIPVYTDYRKKLRNKVYTWLLVRRAFLARTLAVLKLIDW